MEIHALQQIVHKTRDARRKQTLPQYAPAERDMLVLPRTANGTYLAAPRRQLVAGPVRNEHLPNLRARWVRFLVASIAW